MALTAAESANELGEAGAPGGRARVLFTVVIPTCHRNDMLTKCLRTLVPGAQDLAGDLYEVIVSDDGSASTARGMIAEQFAWAKWTAGPRKGPAANRNHGAAMGSGQWIVFVDDDCIPTPGWLAGFRAGLVEGCEVYEGRTICTAGFDGFWNAAPVNETGGNFWSCNLMVSREVFNRLGGFDEGFPHAAWEDVEFAMRVKEAGLKSAMAREAVVDHPPASRHRGTKYAAKWEGLLLIWHKHKKEWATPWHLVRHVAAIRLGELRQNKGLAARWMLARAAVYETVFVAFRVRGWNRRLAKRVVAARGAAAVPV